ncbi:hypothetical protein ACLB2K_051211 [Fragaria x ananassa]
MGDLFVWLISFFLLIALLALVVFQGSLYVLKLRLYSNNNLVEAETKHHQEKIEDLMCLADLEFDYINPYDSSARINRVVLPEYIIEGVLGAIYLVTGHWIMALFTCPYLYYNMTLYTSNRHLIDVTEIFNMLHKEKKQRLFKLFYLDDSNCIGRPRVKRTIAASTDCLAELFSSLPLSCSLQLLLHHD